MSDQSRALPGQPNLRFLKIEAKRRLAAGEFPTLHEAQLAIAREHGMSSWAALKQAVESATSSIALPQVRWVVDRFRDADAPAWAPPDENELRAHFADRYLSAVQVDTLVTTLRGVAARLRAEVVVDRVSGARLRAQVADLRIEAAAEPEPPHRLTALRMYPIGSSVADERTAHPTTRTTGDAPARVVEVAEESFAELGLPGLVVAGPLWTVARGWADLDRQEELRADHRFPAYGVTTLITSTAALRLVADGRTDLATVRDEELGTLIAETTGVPLEDAVTTLVLRPLGMTHSSFTDRPDAVTGYHLAENGRFEEAEPQPGLWTTAPDLVRFGESWSTLLPENLVDEALGWLTNEERNLHGRAGMGPGASVSLIVHEGQVTVAATNRLVPIEPVNARLL